MVLRFDPELYALALSNLVQNAIDASSTGGTVRVALEPKTEEVVLSVSDNGAGISGEHMENIFNPFFTTKPQGTGLGLAIVAKIVDEHDGKISVESHPNEGAVFQVILPRREQA